MTRHTDAEDQTALDVPEDGEESQGPYTCRSCCAATWNDSDVCDECVAEALTAQETQNDRT